MYLIDVSSNNGTINWKDVGVSGVKGVWIKATEGVSYQDPNYALNTVRARANGLRVGAYHFARPDHNSPEAEADHFCRIIGKPKRKDLRPVLDFETKGGSVDWARRFNARCRKNIGITPIFYSYPAFITALNPSKPIGNGLWLASYGKNDGIRYEVVVPHPWKKYVAHQYTSNATLLGVSGHVDKSYAPKLRGVLAYPLKGLL